MSSELRYPGLVVITGHDGELLGVLALVLRKEGFHALTATGDAALGGLLQREPAQLVVLDTTDCPARALAMIENVRRHGNPPIIILAPQQDVTTVRQAYGPDQVDVIPKPFPMQDLLTLVAARLEAGENK